MLIISLLSFYGTSIILFYSIVRKHTLLKTEWGATDDTLFTVIFCMLTPIFNLIIAIILFVKLKT